MAHAANITLITGNPNKARFISEHIATPIKHHALDLDEIQSLDLQKVVDHKVRQAYSILKTPVIVEDTALSFTAFGRLPGTFIRLYVDEIPLETTCRMLDSFDRSATAYSMFGYFDGTTPHFLLGSLQGSIAEHPRGDGGFGWDKIFIPAGQLLTQAELSPEDYATALLSCKPLVALSELLLREHEHTGV